MCQEARTAEDEVRRLQQVVEGQRKRLVSLGMIIDRLDQERSTMKAILDAIVIAKLKEIQASPDGLLSQAEQILRDMG